MSDSNNPNNDVFTTNGSDNFHAGDIEVVVNGSSKGKANVGDKTLGQFVKEQAQKYGLRSFSVYLDSSDSKGEKATTGQSTEKLIDGGYTKIELVAKDARGCDRIHNAR